jgi:hypothetical protein
VSDHDAQRPPTLWSASRWRVAAVTGIVIAATALLAVLVGGTGWHRLAAVAYVVAAVATLTAPRRIGWQVATGLVLCWSVLPVLEGGATFALVPLVVGVVATAELVGLVGRLGIIVERDPGPDLRRLPVTLGLTALISAVTLLVGRIGGPGGLAAVVLAAGACGLLAMVLTGDRASAPHAAPGRLTSRNPRQRRGRPSPPL